MNTLEKEDIKHALIQALSNEREVRRIVIFGSFLRDENPRDLDVAVFQDSTDGYLPLSLRYRKRTRALARRLPLDIIPLRATTSDDPFLREVEKGETIYER